MNNTLQFFITANLFAVFIGLCMALFLLYLLISDQLYKRKKRGMR